MAIQLQLRRGNSATNSSFVGAVGELTFDTETNGLRIHNGSDAGGFVVPVVESSLTSSTENYIKLSNGFVVQWGTTADTASGTISITLPIPMNGDWSTYSAHANVGVTSNNGRIVQILETSTSTTLQVLTNSALRVTWTVMGYSAI